MSENAPSMICPRCGGIMYHTGDMDIDWLHVRCENCDYLTSYDPKDRDTYPAATPHVPDDYEREKAGRGDG